jgi:hypothetical protein
MDASNIPKLKKARQVWKNFQVIISIFLDSSGLIHNEYALEGTTTTKE